jgi:hypothetical protein
VRLVDAAFRFCTWTPAMHDPDSILDEPREFSEADTALAHPLRIPDDYLCCDTHDFIVKTIEDEINIIPALADGHNDVFGSQWVERTLRDVKPFCVQFVANSRAALSPLIVHECDGVRWQAYWQNPPVDAGTHWVYSYKVEGGS